MRDEFASWLLEEASKDKNLFFLTADLGYGVFEDFKLRFPQQYINVGVAEQNLVAVATGLALSGKKCFIYSIANFPVLRCLEQIRNDAAYHNANVKIVSIGGGFSYGNLGFSHHATEDIAVMRSMQNVMVFVPGVLDDVRFALNEMSSTFGTSYIRLDKSFLENSEDFEPPKSRQWRTLRKGEDLTIIGAGGLVKDCLFAGQELERIGIQAKVIDANQFSFISTDSILEAIGKAKFIITAEEHSTRGGLAGIVCEAIAQAGAAKKVLCLGIQDGFLSDVGSQAYLRSLVGLDQKSIVKQACNLVGIPEHASSQKT